MVEKVVTRPSSYAGAVVLHFRGRVLPAAELVDLYVIDGRISYRRPTESETKTVADDGWLVPGLVDAHCHVGLGPEGGVEREEQERQAVANRDSATLLLRDCGSPEDTSWVHERPDLPKLIRHGRHLAPYRRYIPGLAIELEDPAELPEAVAIQAGNGDGWVKIVGDWIDRAVGDLAPCWPGDVVKDAIARAHDAGARVTAHVFGEDALPDLLAAGIDCIEHGTGLTDETIAAMVGQGTALVPTLINIDNFPSIADKATRFPTYAAHMRDLHARSRATVRQAFEAGVPVYAGTDAGGSLPHGLIVDEIAALHGAGLSAADALAAASWTARDWLDRSSFEEGAPADFLVVDEDPREDLDTLRRPRAIVLNGTVY
jgi:imidazolonepropionase-like amidohydrolase